MLPRFLASCFLLLASCFAAGCATTGGPSPKSAKQEEKPAALQKVWNDPDLLLNEAQKYYDASDYSLSLSALQRIINAFPKSDAVAKAQKLSDEVQTRMGVANFKIGVVLPLTGSFARFGESSLDGIACAIGLFEPCGSALTKVQIVVRDTKGDGSVAAEAVKELVEKEKVAVLIGPLVSSESMDAAAQAQALGVPMIILATQEGVTSGRDFIFQHSLLAQTEIKALARQISKTNLKKIIILYPQNRYGEEYHARFVEELKSSGGPKIIAGKKYAADLPDFVGLVEQLTKPLSLGKVGLFIPDSYKQASQIAQALDSLTIQNVKLIGTSRWYHPQLLETPSPALEGTLIGTPFNPEAKREETSQFSDLFYKTYGNPPAWLEAFAFDAIRLALAAFAAKGNNHPQDIRDALLGLKDFPSVSGPLSWDEQRISKWPLDFITVHEGKFSPLP